MEDNEKSSRKYLENRPYRYLQQTAKSLGLPSNFKKIYLIDLILAKRYSSDNEVKCIIARVKLERQQASQTRRDIKKRRVIQHQQSLSILSTPITTTPRRSDLTYVRSRSHFIEKSPLKNNPRRSLIYNIENFTQPKPSNSDRVLRSKIRCVRRNSISSDYMEIVRSRASPRETCIKIQSRENNYPRYNITAKCIVRQRPSTFMARSEGSGPILSVNGSNISKRQRTLSGIYPLVQLENNINMQRQKEGSATKISELQRKSPNQTQKRSADFVQDIMNSIDDSIVYLDDEPHTNIQLQYPNMSVTDSAVGSDFNSSTTSIDISVQGNELPEIPTNYQMRFNDKQNECILPNINKVFGNLNDVHRKDYMQPLFVQVSEDSERFSNVFLPRTNTNTLMLESLFNFRNNLINNAPLPQMVTTNITKCVFSTPTIITAFRQLSKRNGWSLHRFLEVFGTNVAACCALQWYQSEEGDDVKVSATIPEMVEDAYEIISQDGDYMERIGMEGQRMKCFICEWAGPRFIMDMHFRNEHTHKIDRHVKPEWNITYSLKSLVENKEWCRAVVEHGDTLYVLSAKFLQPDRLMANLTTLSSEVVGKSGSITVYNKVTGEPFNWQGAISPIPDHLPDEDHDQLSLPLSKLNLLPNSANLTFINGELITKSPVRVVVGQPELNDIHVIIFVKVVEQSVCEV